jgi:hypothetical protein
MNHQKQGEPISEPFGVPSIFIDGLSEMSTIGAVTYLIFTARQKSPIGGQVERIVQARMIVPTDNLQVIGRALLAGEVAEAPTDENGDTVGLH